MKNTVAAGAACACLLLMAWPIGSQERMAPVDFRPFVDDLATIPPALQSFIQQNGPYLLPAVVHDYLYWKQTCTRDQADQVFLLAMIEHAVPDTRRLAIYQAVHLIGGFAWEQNARDRQAGLVRVLPADRQKITANTLWPSLQQQLLEQRVRDGPDMAIPAAFCGRGDMSVADALGRP